MRELRECFASGAVERRSERSARNAPEAAPQVANEARTRVVGDSNAGSNEGREVFAISRESIMRADRRLRGVGVSTRV
jgi:hypothetical protein